MRVEIPYSYIIRILEFRDEACPASGRAKDYQEKIALLQAQFPPIAV